MKRTKKSPLSEDKLRLPITRLRALAHPLRMRILEFIDKNQSVNVNKIYNSLQLEQSITSQHLRLLRQAGLVSTIRDGKFIYYTIDYSKLMETVSAITTFTTLSDYAIEEDNLEIGEDEN